MERNNSCYVLHNNALGVEILTPMESILEINHAQYLFNIHQLRETRVSNKIFILFGLY